MDTATVHTLVTPVKTRKHRRTRPVEARAPRKTSVREWLAIGWGSAIGGVAIYTTILSLSDLAESIQSVAHVASWKAMAFAAALDANFIATEAFSLFASAAVARATGKATMTTKVITLLMSGIANAYAMSSHQDDQWLKIACVVAGFSLPLLIALSTYTIGKAVRA